MHVLFTSFTNSITRSSSKWKDDLGVEFAGSKQFSSKLARNLLRCAYPLYAVFFLFNLKTRFVSPDASILWTPKGLWTDLYALLYLKVILKKRVVCEKNELAKGIKANVLIKCKGKLIKYVLASIQWFSACLQDELVRYFDHVIAISTHLYNWVYTRNKQVNLIPVLIDPEEAHLKDSHINALNGRPLRIGFFGSLDNQKEGLEDFIVVLARLSSRYKYRFDIYGLASAEVKASLLEILVKYGISDCVCIISPLSGSLARQRMREYDLLVLPRNSNLQTEYGFSTKLGEYLTSGTAVLVTDVSDNGKYIIDKVNGLIAPPDDNAGMELALTYAFLFPGSLSLLGRQGQQLAVDQFSYHIHAPAIYSSMLGCEL